jgi:hypothetical protein
VGVEFQFFNGADQSDQTKRMYEWTGGGVGVFDLNGDSYPDLYFTQGTDWPVEESNDSFTDQVFLNLGGKTFRNVTSETGIQENRFSQGVAVGDINSDGFDDLYVANIGVNRLLLNQGDGTFAEAELPFADSWTTSCAIADLDGDHHPDLYDVNYLEGRELFQKVCNDRENGAPRSCNPIYFHSAADRLIHSSTTGEWQDVTDAVGLSTTQGNGLGIVIADLNEDRNLDLFVANDMTANHYWTRELNGRQYEERALEQGLAFNRNGSAEACMGIAVGDWDLDADLDLVVTNYYQESNTGYENQGRGLFTETTRKQGLFTDSLDVLGFGTQFLDADNDGRLDLVIVNGHLDDRTDNGTPFDMPALLYRNLGDTMKREIGGPFFARRLIGRGLAKLDWNRDGQIEFAVSQLHGPACLTINRTNSTNSYLAFKLIGTTSARHPVGTKVTLVTDLREYVQTLTAGDGYQASNEKLILFGLPSEETPLSAEIDWPSGRTDTLQNLEREIHYVLVEGESARALP